MRFGCELLGWISVFWALSDRSLLLAAGAVLLLIVVPTVFATPGDKAHALVAVPGAAAVGLDLLQFTAAAAAAWWAWPAPAAVAVTAWAASAAVLQWPRWRLLALTPASGRPAAR
nr:hypothetical protein [Streptomonospora nanhaiensis]